VEILALWAAVFNRDGTAAVAAEMSRLDTPFLVFPLHEAQINYLINRARLTKETRAAALTARATWNHRFTEGWFARGKRELEDWSAAAQLVLEWQTGKTVLESPQVMIHAALAVLNNFDTFLSVSPQARQAAQDMGLTVLPKVLR